MSQYPPQQSWGLPPEEPGQRGQQQPPPPSQNYSQPLQPPSPSAWQQQPNTGYPSGQQWPQQAQLRPSYLQPGQYQQSYYPPGPSITPPQPPKKKGGRTTLIISILVAVMLLSGGGIVAIMSSTAKGTDSIGNTATVQPTLSGMDATVTAVDATTQAQANVIPTDIPTPTVSPAQIETLYKALTISSIFALFYCLLHLVLEDELQTQDVEEKVQFS